MLHAMIEATAGAGEPTALPGERFLPRGGRVLVVRLSALGDVLFALETVAALRRERPDAAIDFLVEDRFAHLLEGHPDLDRVLVYPRRRRLQIPASLWRLRKTRYDLALDLHGIQKSAMHMFCCRARVKVGPAPPVAREGASFSYDLSVALPDSAVHRAEIGHALLAAVGLSGPYDFYPFTSERSIAAMSQWPRPEETQPITFARADAPPLLLVTSDGDETVRPKNANNLAAKLQGLGATAEVINYGPLTHEEVVMALSVPFRAKGPVLADSARFLRQHLAR